jgi:ADP-ribose pyrophosphatase
MNDFELLSEEIAYSNPYFSILDRLYLLPDGTEHHYFVRKEVDTCCVLAMTKEGQFILEEEFRVGAGETTLQLPAGRLEGADDNPDERIAKELLEETGYAGEIKKIAELPTSPYSTRKIHCYYATNCERVSEQSLDETEFITVKLMSLEDTQEFFLTGKSSSCAPGILAWEWMKKDGALKS